MRLLQRLYSAGLSSTTIARLLPCVDLPSEKATAASVALMREEFARLSGRIEALHAARDRLGRILADAGATLEDARSLHTEAPGIRRIAPACSSAPLVLSAPMPRCRV